MLKFIQITFPVKKKNKDDTYRCFARYDELGENRSFTLQETNRVLQRQHHQVAEGCLVEDMKTGETFKCFHVGFTEGRSKHPILQVAPV